MAKLLTGVSVTFEFITTDQQRVLAYFSSHYGRYVWTVILSNRVILNEWYNGESLDRVDYPTAKIITEMALKKDDEL